MARRRRRRKSSYDQPVPVETGSSQIVLEELSPRARRLVEGGVIDLDTVDGSGEDGRITSGDILHAARLLEVEQSVARIEATTPAGNGSSTTEDTNPPPESRVDATAAFPVGDNADPPPAPEPTDDSESEPHAAGDPHESATFTSVHVGGEPIAVESSPWEDYNGSTDGFSDLARKGAEQSWGEAEAHITAMQQEAAAQTQHQDAELPAAVSESASAATPAQPISHTDQTIEGPGDEGPVEESIEPAASAEQIPAAQAPREEMMDFGTLEHVDPESVWAQGAEDFAPWFLAHSQQLGAVLGLQAGLSDARQFTTKSATGVLGRDDNGEDVVVVSSKSAVADDSDLGRALGMAASSGAASVALVSAALHEDQLKALAWLNNQTRSGVKWYGIEMSVVRIADSPAAMLFDLVAAPGQSDGQAQSA